MVRLKYVPVRLCAHPRSGCAAWAHKPAILMNRNVKNVQLSLRSDAREGAQLSAHKATNCGPPEGEASGPPADAETYILTVRFISLFSLSQAGAPRAAACNCAVLVAAPLAPALVFNCTIMLCAKGRSLRGTQQSRERLILRASAAGGCGPRDLKVAKHGPVI